MRVTSRGVPTRVTSESSLISVSDKAKRQSKSYSNDKDLEIVS